MHIKFHTRQLILFSPKSIAQLKELTLIGESQMRTAIDTGSPNNIAITAKLNNKLIAWCLVQKRHRHPRRHHAIVQVFVAPDYRRNGIGAKLIVRATNYIKRCGSFKEITCAPWNTDSKMFFKTTGFSSKNKSKIWSKNVKV